MNLCCDRGVYLNKFGLIFTGYTMNKKYILLAFIPVILIMLYFGNIKPFMASHAGVKGEIEKALAYNTFVNFELRKLLAQKAVKSKDFNLVWFVKGELEKNILERPMDVQSYMMLAYFYSILGERAKTLETAEKAIELAPNRPDIRNFYNMIRQE
jgi:hypothetical protein